MPKYDIVVVGAGNAGMSAALQCQLAGKKTLLIEKHNLPGGAATSFVRGRFEIEPSLHELCDFGPPDNPGDTRRILDSYGVKLNWHECKDCFRVISKYSDGSPMDVTMPAGIDNFIDKMEEYVPGSREKMRTLFFDALKLPKKCQDILSTYWSYLGVDMEHLAFIHYAAMVHKYVQRSAYIPEHTSHQYSTAMIERFRELGGDVWFNCRAEEFLFNGDKLCGVRTNLGDIECDYALANINPDIELIPEREKKLSAARGRIMGGRMFTAYFCCDATPEELGITDYSYFLPSTANSVVEYKRIRGGMKTNDYSIFLCYNIVLPEFSPPGTCVCSFTTFGAPEEWGELKQEDYFRFKNEGAKKMLRSLKEKTGIDLEGHIEEMEVASPWTFARYLGVPEGSVYGYEARDWDGMMARMQMIGSDYPIKGLRPIGAAGPRSDGYSATIVCGQLIAGSALRDLKAWSEGGKK